MVWTQKVPKSLSCVESGRRELYHPVVSAVGSRAVQRVTGRDLEAHSSLPRSSLLSRGPGHPTRAAFLPAVLPPCLFSCWLCQPWARPNETVSQNKPLLTVLCLSKEESNKDIFQPQTDLKWKLKKVKTWTEAVNISINKRWEQIP